MDQTSRSDRESSLLADIRGLAERWVDGELTTREFTDLGVARFERRGSETSGQEH